MMKRNLTILAAAAALTVTSGCATKAQTGALIGAVVGGGIGSAVGAGVGTTAAIVGGVVIGTVVGGSIGAKMDREDQKKAFAAIESNKSASWSNSDTTYMITPTKSTEDQRKFDMKMEKNGKETIEETTYNKKKGKWIRE